MWIWILLPPQTPLLLHTTDPPVGLSKCPQWIEMLVVDECRVNGPLRLSHINRVYPITHHLCHSCVFGYFGYSEPLRENRTPTSAAPSLATPDPNANDKSSGPRRSKCKGKKVSKYSEANELVPQLADAEAEGAVLDSPYLQSVEMFTASISPSETATHPSGSLFLLLIQELFYSS